MAPMGWHVLAGLTVSATRGLISGVVCLRSMISSGMNHSAAVWAAVASGASSQGGLMNAQTRELTRRSTVR